MLLIEKDLHWNLAVIGFCISFTGAVSTRDFVRLRLLTVYSGHSPQSVFTDKEYYIKPRQEEWFQKASDSMKMDNRGKQRMQ